MIKAEGKQQNKYIFCYLDILGYKSLVEAHCDNEETIKAFNSIMEESVMRLLEGFREHLDDTETSMNVEGIYKNIKFTLISDTILIRMPLITTTNEKSHKVNVDAISVFLHYVSFLVLTFIYNTGYFLRGGISIGQHYEKSSNETGLFIFSKALIQAYNLEQKAKTIRILIDTEIIHFLARNVESDYSYYEKDFYKDLDGIFCLNYYSSLVNGNMADDFFVRLLDNIYGQTSSNKEDVGILTKYLGFIKYHNENVIKKFNKTEYKIDLNRLFEEVIK